MGLAWTAPAVAEIPSVAFRLQLFHRVHFDTSRDCCIITRIIAHGLETGHSLGKLHNPEVVWPASKTARLPLEEEGTHAQLLAATTLFPAVCRYWNSARNTVKASTGTAWRGKAGGFLRDSGTVLSSKRRQAQEGSLL